MLKSAAGVGPLLWALMWLESPGLVAVCTEPRLARQRVRLALGVFALLIPSSYASPSQPSQDYDSGSKDKLPW